MISLPLAQSRNFRVDIRQAEDQPHRFDVQTICRHCEEPIDCVSYHVSTPAELPTVHAIYDDLTVAHTRTEMHICKG